MAGQIEIPYLSGDSVDDIIRDFKKPIADANKDANEARAYLKSHPDDPMAALNAQRAQDNLDRLVSALSAMIKRAGDTIQAVIQAIGR